MARSRATREQFEELPAELPPAAEVPPEDPPAAAIAPVKTSPAKKTRRPKLIKAGPCPRRKDQPHTDTWIYRTDPQTGVRYCKCNECGELWKVTGPTGADVDSKLAAAAA